MTNRIYHNPRCSKSRQTLKILENYGIKFKIVSYLDAPLSTKELKEICEMLEIKPQKLIRTHESLFQELKLSLKDVRSEDEWIDLLITHPKLIERPIVIHEGKAIIARPPEKVLEIF